MIFVDLNKFSVFFCLDFLVLKIQFSACNLISKTGYPINKQLFAT